MVNTSQLTILIAGLVSADNNTTKGDIQKHIEDLKKIKDSLSSEYESFISRIDRAISILEKDLKNYGSVEK